MVLLDEVDALVGDTLIALLRQLRDGYPKRPARFPQSIVLCGVRDVRDYRIHAGGEVITGGSAFNIKSESLRLGDFTSEDVAALYDQHRTQTGQPFTDEALREAWRLTRGQPWLVNALAYEACFRFAPGTPSVQPVTVAALRQAAERLILRRDTHLDQLMDKSRESRVRHVIEPMLLGTDVAGVPDDDVQYLVDLGLIRRESGSGWRVANPIYQEVLPRALNRSTEDSICLTDERYLRPDGRLDLEQLLESFLRFWRQHGEPLMRKQPYPEAAPHLVLMAFLQGIVNGRGSIEREYAVGLGRMDLCVRFGAESFGFELKVWREGRPDPLPEGLAQLEAYLAGLDLSAGWLVIFDQRTGQPPVAERTGAVSAVTPAGRRVTVVRA